VSTADRSENPPEPRTERVVLILADISGYTRFMLASQESLVHGQQVITELLESIIREVEIPLEIKEIEGDAVFLYAVKPDDDAAWEEVRRIIGSKLVRFFEAFARTILELSESTLCPCAVCRNLDQLELKIVVHSGEALFHRVGRFSDISGVDVILVHRLLKNSVASNEYVLMTEAAYREIGFPVDVEVSKGEEHYPGFGAIPTYTYVTKGGGPPTRDALEHYYAAPFRAFGTDLRWFAKGYFGQLPILLGWTKPRKFGELDELPVRRSVRVALALGLVLLAPLMVPAGIAFQAYRVLTRKRRVAAAEA
jgi:class 3 adenylate cyclase